MHLVDVAQRRFHAPFELDCRRLHPVHLRCGRGAALDERRVSGAGLAGGAAGRFSRLTCGGEPLHHQGEGVVGRPLVDVETLDRLSGLRLTRIERVDLLADPANLGSDEVGTLLDTPVRVLGSVPSSVTLAAPPAAAAGVATTALVEDGTGGGAQVQAVPMVGTSDVALSGGAASLEPPLRLLWDLVEVSRGATVRAEQLGRGDAAAAGQDFALAKSPVTFRAEAWIGTMILSALTVALPSATSPSTPVAPNAMASAEAL